MQDLLSTTWAGSFQYNNSRMPLVSLAAVFQKTSDNEFNGEISEAPFVLPAAFKTALDIPTPRILTAWGSIAGQVTLGEIADITDPHIKRHLHFLKTSDQLSGYPVYCWGVLDAKENKMIGKWKLVEDGKPSSLPNNLKSGIFTLRKEEVRRTDTPFALPVTPELLLL